LPETARFAAVKAIDTSSASQVSFPDYQRPTIAGSVQFILGSMKIEDLASFESASLFEADLVIVGGGPARPTIAFQRRGTPHNCVDRRTHVHRFRSRRTTAAEA
jgi:hypothetical protein